MDTSCDGYVDWNEFCTYMLLQYRENDYMRTQKQIPFQQEPRIRHIVHNRVSMNTGTYPLLLMMGGQGQYYEHNQVNSINMEI